MRAATLAAAAVGVASGKTYFKETFDSTWEDRWTVSDWKKSAGTAGEWKYTAGDAYGDAEADKGIQTGQDARFYAISAPLDEPMDNTGKDLVLQFSVKHQQKIDCGGGYIKLFPDGHDSKSFGGESPYNIMFGPDICGTSTKKVHVIFNYKGDNKLTTKSISCETDQHSHVYTLIVHPDQTYEVRIDGDKKASGAMLDDWDFLPAKEIKDPDVSKPDDWVDESKIDDPEDTKPEGWDDIPKQLADPEAEKPDDWDDEDDGEWEPPMIDNPDYKGEWKAKKIDNPDYKGVWVHPMIDNPEYELDETIYQSKSTHVGFDLWQVKAGSIFDNIYVGDDIAEAEAFMAETYTKNIAGEKEMFEAAETKRKEEEEEERKRIEEERKKQEEEEDDEEDEDEEDEDEKDEL